MRKMSKLFSLMAAVALVMVSKSALADAPAAPTITVGGLVDTYYTYNFTNSQVANGAGNVPGAFPNLGSYFNTKDESFELGMAEVSVAATQGDASGHIVLNMGQEANLGLAGVNGFQVLQAYASLVADKFTFSGGRMATWMGNEVIESKGNWNYSRSTMFWATIPLWHTGISVNYAPDSVFGTTVYIVDGWNNWGVVTGSTGFDVGKTYGLQVALHPDASTAIILNGIVGPGGVLSGQDPADARYTAELIASVAVSDKFSLALDAEYFGQDTDIPFPPATTGGSLTGWGVDLYARYQIESDWAAALRLEELYDDNGYAGLAGPAIPPATGTASGEARSATLTVEHNFTPQMLFRVEGRMDMAVYGGTSLSATTTPAGPYAAGSGTQTTASASAVYSF